MTKHVLKGRQAEKGQEVLVEPRAPVIGAPDAADVIPVESPFVAAATGAPHDAAHHPVLLASAEQQAARVLAEARTQAEVLQQRAQADAARLREQTEHELSQRAAELEKRVRADVEKQYAERYAAALKALEASAAELRARQDDYLAYIELPAFRLVLAVARQLLATEIARPEQHVAALIARAFALLKPEQVVVVALNPVTYSAVTADSTLLSALPAAGISLKRVEFAADESLRPDQFSARINGVSIDYDLSAALAEIVAHLEERAAAHSPGAGQPAASAEDG